MYYYRTFLFSSVVLVRLLLLQVCKNDTRYHTWYVQGRSLSTIGQWKCAQTIPPTRLNFFLCVQNLILYKKSTYSNNSNVRIISLVVKYLPSKQMSGVRFSDNAIRLFILALFAIFITRLSIQVQ